MRHVRVSEEGVTTDLRPLFKAVQLALRTGEDLRDGLLLDAGGALPAEGHRRLGQLLADTQLHEGLNGSVGVRLGQAWAPKLAPHGSGSCVCSVE